jgi:hypothetical protein
MSKMELIMFYLDILGVHFTWNLRHEKLFVKNTFYNHYEKLCPLEPHCFTIKAPKELIYNYTTTKAWKYV